MPKYKLSPRAKRQMRSIWRDIAVHNEPAADALVRKLFDKFELVAHHPEMGPAHPEISKAARLIIEGRHARSVDLARSIECRVCNTPKTRAQLPK